MPGCIDKSPPGLRPSFAWLYVDDYEPTKLGIKSPWGRLNTGRVLSPDDDYPGHNAEASLAIKELLRLHNDFDLVDLQNNQMVLRRE